MWGMPHSLHRYCNGSPTGVLDSRDNCGELCTSCYRSRCPSSVRMGQQSSVACQAEAVSEFLKFQMSPCSTYVAFTCPSQGLISFPQCGRAGRTVWAAVCWSLRSTGATRAEQQPVPGGDGCSAPRAFLQPETQGWFESPHPLQASLTAQNWSAIVTSVCCLVGVGRTSGPLLSAGVTSVGQLEESVPLGGLKTQLSCSGGFLQRTESPVHGRHNFVNSGSLHMI